MKIIITGSSGLIGQKLVPLLQKNHELTLLTIDFSKEWSVALLPQDADVIIHLAQSHNHKAFPEKAMDIFNVNTYSTMKLLDYGRDIGIKQFIYASSGGIYGSGDTPFNETYSLNTQEDIGFYLNSKLTSELLLKNYQGFFNVISLRFFFVYGPQQKKQMLIPRLINNIRAKKPITLSHHKGICINPIFVDDAAVAIEKSLHIKENRIINIAGTETISLKDLCDSIASKLECEVFYNYTDTPAKNLVADITLMTQELHTPQIQISEGITRMIEELF